MKSSKDGYGPTPKKTKAHDKVGKLGTESAKQLVPPKTHVEKHHKHMQEHKHHLKEHHHHLKKHMDHMHKHEKHMDGMLKGMKDGAAKMAKTVHEGKKGHEPWDVKDSAKKMAKTVHEGVIKRKKR